MYNSDTCLDIILQVVVHFDEPGGPVLGDDVERHRVDYVSGGDLDDVGVGGERPDGRRGDHARGHRTGVDIAGRRSHFLEFFDLQGEIYRFISRFWFLLCSSFQYNIGKNNDFLLW